VPSFGETVTATAVVLAAVLAVAPIAEASPVGASSCPGVQVRYGPTVYLGSGVTRRPGAVGAVRVQVVSADLTRAHVTVAHDSRMRPGRATKGGVVAFAKASRKALITVNGDYFAHGIPRGPLVDGSVLHMDSVAIAHPRALVLDAKPSIQRLHIAGTLALGSRRFPVAAVNSTLSRNGVLVFTKAWSGPLPKGYRLNVGHNRVVVTGALARKVAAARKVAHGHRSLVLMAETDTGTAVRHGLGVGNDVLVRGVPVCSQSKSSSRVVIGWSKDGRRLFIATAILNRPMPIRNRGLAGYQLAQVLKRAGAYSAVLLDGGGSTAMIQKHGTRSIAYTADHFIRPTVTGLVISS
jgi:Phosphodiester glycosidase